jgi:hypothetical protein
MLTDDLLLMFTEDNNTLLALGACQRGVTATQHGMDRGLSAHSRRLGVRGEPPPAASRRGSAAQLISSQ